MATSCEIARAKQISFYVSSAKRYWAHLRVWAGAANLQLWFRHWLARCWRLRCVFVWQVHMGSDVSKCNWWLRFNVKRFSLKIYRNVPNSDGVFTVYYCIFSNEGCFRSSMCWIRHLPKITILYRRTNTLIQHSERSKRHSLHRPQIRRQIGRYS